MDLDCLTIRKIFLLLRGDGIVFFRMLCACFINFTISFSCTDRQEKWLFSYGFVDGQTVDIFFASVIKFVLKPCRYENIHQSNFICGCQYDVRMFAMLHNALSCLRHIYFWSNVVINIDSACLLPHLRSTFIALYFKRKLELTCALDFMSLA